MILFLFLLKKFTNFFFSNKLINKILYFFKLVFEIINILDDFLLLSFIKIKRRTINISIIIITNKKKIDIFIYKLKENSFVKIFLFNLAKLFLKTLKIILNFLGFITYQIWSYLNTILLYALGYILLEFGATRLYDPTQDITSREIYEVISKKLNSLKKKHLTKSNILRVSQLLLNKLNEIFIYYYTCAKSFLVFLFYKLKYNTKDFNINLYLFCSTLTFVLATNNFLFLKKLIYVKNFKIKIVSFFKNFLIYFNFNFTKIFINLFKNKRFFFIKKKNFWKKKIYEFD